MTQWQQSVDWTRLSKVLSVAATRAVRHAPQTFDCGLSAEDLVGETLALFFGSSNALGYNSEKGSLEQFLVRVLQNKAVDHLRRQKHVGGSFDDKDGRLPKPQEPATALEEAEYPDLLDKLYRLVKDEPELRDLIAAGELSGGPKLNEELGEIITKTPREVVNLKRRLLNRPGVRELLNGRRQVGRKQPER